MKSRLFNILKVVVSVVMLTYVLLTVDLGELLATAADARLSYLVLAALLMIGSVALRAVRWLVLLRALNITTPLSRLIKLYFVGTFFNIFLPTGLGGDAIRMMELARLSRQTPEAIGTVLVDRATGLWVLFIIGLLTLPFGRAAIPLQTALVIAVVAAVGVIGGWVVMGTPLLPWLGGRIRLPGQEKLERFYRAVSGCGYPALGKACGISLIFNLVNIAASYVIALGLNVHLPLSVFFMFTPVISLSLMLPSVGGLGVREETFRRMFGTVGVPGGTAVAMSLTNYLLQPVIPGLIGGLLYAIDGLLGLRGEPASSGSE